MAVITLDDYFRAATTVAFGAGAAPLVWLALAFAVIVTLVVSFASCCLSFYDADNRMEDAMLRRRIQKMETLVTDIGTKIMTPDSPSVPPEAIAVNNELRYLDDIVMYVDREKSMFFVPRGTNIQRLL